MIDIVFADFEGESNVVETTITYLCSIIVRTNEILKKDTNSNRNTKIYRKKLVETKTAQNASPFEL